MRATDSLRRDRDEVTVTMAPGGVSDRVAPGRTSQLGFGDVALAPVLGLALGWLGWGATLVGLLGGFVIGALVAWCCSACSSGSLCGVRTWASSDLPDRDGCRRPGKVGRFE